MGDLELMEQVQKLAGTALDVFAPTSSIPEGFWASLTCNESEGEIGASRFEPAVHAHLVAVTNGEQSAYGDITSAAIAAKEATVKAATFHAQFLDSAWVSSHQADLTACDDETLRRLATSYGWTQVMGYHTIEWGVPISSLRDPAEHYRLASRLMADFIKAYSLDPTQDFEGMGRCWNGGHPTAKTWDPNYIPNLINRMRIWDSLAAG